MSTAIYLLLIDISLSNDQLSDESKQDLINLQIYNENATSANPFTSDSSFNYSLTDYSNTGEFQQSNLEAKGAVLSILEIFGENKLTALATPLYFISTMLPFDDGAFKWSYIMILTFVGIVLFIAFIAAWKGGIF